MNEIVLSDKIRSLLNDPDFLMKMMRSENLDEIKKLFEKKEVFVTDAELGSIFASIDEFVSLNKNEKLDDSALSNVSGGGLVTIITIALLGAGAAGYGSGYIKRGKTAAIKKEIAAINKDSDILNLQQALDTVKKSKAIEQYKTDKTLTLGTTAVSLSAILLFLNYYKNDIYKFWNSKKKAWFGDNKGSGTKK